MWYCYKLLTGVQTISTFDFVGFLSEFLSNSSIRNTAITCFSQKMANDLLFLETKFKTKSSQSFQKYSQLYSDQEQQTHTDNYTS